MQRLSLICVLPLLGAPDRASAAQIRGALVTESGKPVANAHVSVHKNTANAPVSVAKTLVATTDNKGAFVLDGLDQADYSVCVHAPGTDLLDTCRWGISLPLAKVPSAQATVDYKGIVTQGATIRIRVEDPEELISNPPKPGDHRMLLPGVWTKQGIFLQAALLSSDRAGHDYELIVPPRTALRLAFTLFNLQLIDQKGYVVGEKAGWDLLAQAGSVQKFQFRIAAPGK